MTFLTSVDYNFIVIEYTQIQQAFTVFGPLLTEPLLHQRRIFDSCHQIWAIPHKFHTPPVEDLINIFFRSVNRGVNSK